MKKNLFIGGIAFVIAATSLKPLVTPVNAETSIFTKQTQQLPKITPTAKSQIELISEGAEPRQELRLKPTISTKETANMRLNIDMMTSMAGKTLPAFKMPATVITFESVVKNVESNGDINYDFTYTDADVVGDTNLPPAAVAQMRAEMKKLKRFKGSVVIDNRAQTKKANFSVPPGSDPSFKQMIDQMSNSIEQISAPLPQQAVGIGAKWQVTNAVNVSGMAINQVATYELVDFKDGVATLNINLAQQAPKAQKLNLPQSPKGVTVTLKSYIGSGQGRALVRVNKLIPITSTMTMRANSQISTVVPNTKEELTLDQQMSMLLSIKSK